MVRALILADVWCFESRVVRQLAALLVLVTPLVLLLRLMQQPEAIGDYQSHGHDGNADDQHQASAFLLAALRLVLRGAFGTTSGFFG